MPKRNPPQYTESKTAQMGASEGVADAEEDDKKAASDKPTKRITRRDWDKVETYLKDELDKRKNSEARKAHEAIWKEVDRQVQMRPMQKFNRDGSQVDMGWHNVVELGELSKSSENISADV